MRLVEVGMLSKLFGLIGRSPPKIAYDNDESRDLLQQISAGAVAAIGEDGSKILLYAEVEGGVISADLFAQANGAPVRFRFAPPALRSLVYRFWEIASEPWFTMSFTIEDGRFNCSLGYADTLRSDEDLADRRPRVISEHFRDAKVDYSAPQG